MLSEMDGLKVAQAGSVSEEKQCGLFCTNALSSFGIGQCSGTHVPLLCYEIPTLPSTQN